MADQVPEPDPAGLDLDDPAVVSRFGAAYRGRHDPRDALWWVRHPDTTSPRGVQSPAAALRLARRAVYRPDARTGDRRRVEALAAAIEQDRADTAAALAAAAAAPAPAHEEADRSVTAPTAPGSATAPHPARAVLIAGGALLAAAGLVGAGIAVGGTGRAAPTPGPTYRIESQPIPFLGGPAAVARSRRDLAALFDHPKTAFLGYYLSTHSTTLSASIRSNSIAKEGTAVGPHTFSLAGIRNDQPTGVLSILLTCSRSTPYAWTLTAPGAKPVRVRGPECHGHIVASTFVPPPNHVPTELHVTVPRDVRVIVEADLSRY